MTGESNDIYRHQRRELEAAHLAGAGGVEVCLRHSLLVDQLVRSVLGAAGGAGGVAGLAVVAVGGYGRQELCFASDIDLLFLVPRLDRRAADLTKQVFYGLLGLGLPVSHGVRTVADCLKMAPDLETLTSLLDCRLVAGQGAVCRELERRLGGWLARHGGEAVARLKRSVEERHGRYRGPAYLFEPQVKEGCGGLRDAHALVWAARGQGLTPRGLADLAALGLIDGDEAEALKQSVDFLLRVRNHLHLVTGKKCDQLLFAQQAELAGHFGLVAGGAAPPVEAFMRLFHHHSSQVGYLCRLGLSRLGHEGASPRRCAAPLLDAQAIKERPERMLEVFALAAADSGEPEAATARLVRQHLHLVDERLRRSPEAARHFLATLGAAAAPQALENMLHAGLLSAYLPEFERIRFLVQHDGYHVHTADVHSIETVAELVRLRQGHYEAAEPVLTGLAREAERAELLHLAALLHDIGKGGDGPHEVLGAELARTVGRRLGLAEAEVAELGLLVEGHLLLAEAAQRGDLGDEDFLRQLAAGLEERRLKALYLLTFADSKATGPASWTSWKSALIGELFFRLLAVLGEPEWARPAHGEACAETVVARLSREIPTERVSWHLRQLPAEYLAAVDVETACEQILLAEGLLRGGRPLEWAARAEGGLYTLSLVALDRPGLLAKAAGHFALHGLAIHEARLYTRHDALAVDTFRLSPALKNAPPPAWERVMADLAAGLSGRISLPYRLAKRFRPSPLERHDLPEVATEVSVNNQVSALNTVIEVKTRDRVGLLYLLASALFELELNIYLARVTTKGHQACDVFYVRDFSGNKLLEPGHIEETRRAIRFALDG